MSIILANFETLNVVADAAATTGTYEGAAKVSFAVPGGNLASNVAQTAGTTPVPLVQAQGATVVSGVTVRNVDTVSHTFTLSTITSAGVSTPLVTADVPSGGVLYYEAGQGWNLLGADGLPLSAAGVTSVNGKTGVVVLSAADVGAATTAQGAKADTALQWADVSPAYIDSNGLILSWTSGTALSVSGGSAYVPSAGKVLTLSAAISKSGLSLTASAFYHVYLDGSDPSEPGIVVSTTAPDSAYRGTARTMTGDTSKRYLGSVLTDSSGAIYRFLHSGEAGEITYVVDPGKAPFRVVSSGSATTPTLMDLSGVMPTTAEVGSFKLTNFATSPTVLVYLDSAGTTSLFNASAGQSLFCYSAAPGRVLYYAYAATPSGSSFAYFDVRGYKFER